jgi:lipopolysaccharide transport system ATP-binding protein
MQAINQLCDRAIWLEGGEVLADGDPSDVIRQYLQSTFGSGSQISWPDESGPGDDLARLQSVRVVAEDGETVGNIDVRSPIGIEIRFRVLREGPPVFGKIKVYDRQGNIAFNAMDIAPHSEEGSEPGVYVTTAWIPPNLLNEGRSTVDAAVCTLHAPKLHPRAFRPDAVSFMVYDPGDGDSARGRFTGQLRGSVRPLLEWTTERVD